MTAQTDQTLVAAQADAMVCLRGRVQSNAWVKPVGLDRKKVARHRMW